MFADGFLSSSFPHPHSHGISGFLSLLIDFLIKLFIYPLRDIRIVLAG